MFPCATLSEEGLKGCYRYAVALGFRSISNDAPTGCGVSPVGVKSVLGRHVGKQENQDGLLTRWWRVVLLSLLSFCTSDSSVSNSTKRLATLVQIAPEITLPLAARLGGNFVGHFQFEKKTKQKEKKVIS